MARRKSKRLTHCWASVPGLVGLWHVTQTTPCGTVTGIIARSRKPQKSTLHRRHFVVRTVPVESLPRRCRGICMFGFVRVGAPRGRSSRARTSALAASSHCWRKYHSRWHPWWHWHVQQLQLHQGVSPRASKQTAHCSVLGRGDGAAANGINARAADMANRLPAGDLVT